MTTEFEQVSTSSTPAVITPAFSSTSVFQTISVPSPSGSRAPNTTITTDPLPQSLITIPTSSNFQTNKSIKEAAKHWNNFYISNSRFFKDRHWLEEFKAVAELNNSDSKGKGKEKGKVVLECGAGTGAFVYPILQKFDKVRIHCFDFSERAVELIQEHPDYNPAKVNAFTHDLTLPYQTLFNHLSSASPEFHGKRSLGEEEAVELPDLISCIFVLSALTPVDHFKCIKTLVDLLAVDGTLIMRDYALYDEVQIRFHLDPAQQWSSIPALLSKPTSSTATPPSLSTTTNDTSIALDTNTNDNKAWYKRGDQTMTYFFTMEEIKRHIELSCTGKEWELIGEMVVVSCAVENRKDKLDMQRRFVQGSWTKVLRN